MQTQAIADTQAGLSRMPLNSVDAVSSGVSWAAILAGAAAASALSLVLLILGFGLGLSAWSPWSEHAADSSTIGISSIAWVAFTQIFAAGLGGYLAGRLRVKWADTHSDEIYFRDTAHGFLSWAIASLLAATLLGSATTTALSGGLRAGAAAATAVAGIGGIAAHNSTIDNNAAAGKDAGADNKPATMANDASSTGIGNPLQYFADALFRSDRSDSQINPDQVQPGNRPAVQSAAPQSSSLQSNRPPANENDRARASAEALRIFAYNFRSGALSQGDKEYLGQLISRQTGLTQADAEKRASDTFYQLTTSVAKAEMTAKETADKARKAAAHTSLWMFIALLAGAFCASLSATLGGRQRDEI